MSGENPKVLLVDDDKDLLQLIAMTGWGQEVDKERTREAGFDVHLVKPVEVDDLQRTLALRERKPRSS